MKTRTLVLSGAALIALYVPSVFAQQSSTTTTTDPQSIAQRKNNQQDRIAQGVKSGQLTAGETARLEKQQQSINHEDASMRKADGGKLTGADKEALNHRQNNASKNIYNKKHNGAARE